MAMGCAWSGSGIWTKQSTVNKINQLTLIGMRFQTAFTYQETEYCDQWVSFYPKFCDAGFEVNIPAYFDPRPQIVTNIASLMFFALIVSGLFMGFAWWYIVGLSLLSMYVGWGQLFISLPINTGKPDECDGDTFGFCFYRVDSGIPSLPDCLVIQWGGTRSSRKFRYKSFDMPWGFKFYRHSLLLKDGTWVHDYEKMRGKPQDSPLWVDGKRRMFYDDYWKDKRLSYQYDYTDSFDGQIIPTTISVEEREWRRIGLFGLSLFNKVRRVIEVKFHKEVGERKGSWKGGTVGCGYDLLPGEHPMDCLKRMEKERSF